LEATLKRMKSVAGSGWSHLEPNLFISKSATE
jgi:hypothetical protein